MLVYKFCRKDTGECIYVGSTSMTLNRRFRCHRAEANTEPIPFHAYVLENGGWDAYEISIVEECEEADKMSLRIRERYWYDTLKPICNKHRPYTSSDEKRAENSARNYSSYIANRDVINERRNLRRKHLRAAKKAANREIQAVADPA